MILDLYPESDQRQNLMTSMGSPLPSLVDIRVHELSCIQGQTERDTDVPADGNTGTCSACRRAGN